jgi:predicted nuclease of predicted toxin-antitoxin system
LRAAGATVVVHDDLFAQDALDETWLAGVGERSWVVLTKDRRIRHRQSELLALVDAGVRAFVLTAGNITGEEMAAAFVSALPRMLRLIQRESPPFIATVSRSGLVRLLNIPGQRVP